MFIRFYELEYSRKAVISRLRRELIGFYGEHHIRFGHKLQRVGPKRHEIVQNKDNLVIDMHKNGEEVSITVTPFLGDSRCITVMVPKVLIPIQFRPTLDSESMKTTWITGKGKNVLGYDQKDNGHLMFIVRAPLNHEKESHLRFVVKNACDLGDDSEDESDSDDVIETGSEPAPEIIDVDSD